MKAKRILLTLLFAAGLLGCGRQQHPRHIVILPDVSGSIERESLQQAFKAIDDLVEHLQRGDRIAIIPILGDAQAEASGRIIRFEVPEERQAYDSDLRDFRRKLGTSLTEMRANAMTYPGSKTDILGSIELAAQEFQSGSRLGEQRLIILSDFIQEDGELDFRTDEHLTNRVRAKFFAKQLAKSSFATRNCKGLQAYLGFLSSREYRLLDKNRRAAVYEFWTFYLECLGVQSKFTVDGPGFLGSILK